MPATPLEGPTQRRLNVNIPAVEMERYSVMFEKLLKPQASLMERRQTIVKQLNLPNQPSGGVSFQAAKVLTKWWANKTTSLLQSLLLCNVAQHHQTSAVALP